MDDLQLIVWQTQALAAAGKRDDWDGIQQLDSDIARHLCHLHGRAISEQYRHALTGLRQVHHEVHQSVRQQRDALQHALLDQRDRRDGALSYAQFMDEESPGNA